MCTCFTHKTQYYEIQLVTFGADKHHSLVIAFPAFIKGSNRESLDLHEIETVHVPIKYLNRADNSYITVAGSKPYMAINDENDIQIYIQDLCMC